MHRLSSTCASEAGISTARFEVTSASMLFDANNWVIHFTPNDPGDLTVALYTKGIRQWAGTSVKLMDVRGISHADTASVLRSLNFYGEITRENVMEQLSGNGTLLYLAYSSKLKVETILWSGSISVERSEISLADDVNNYNYLKIYGRFYAGSSGEYLLGEYIATRSSYVVRDLNLADNIADVGLEIAEVNLVRDNDNKVVRINGNHHWRWNGDATSNASKQNITNLAIITRVVGVR